MSAIKRGMNGPIPTVEMVEAERAIDPPLMLGAVNDLPPTPLAAIEDILVRVPSAEVEAVARAICVADDRADPDELGCFWTRRANGPRWWLYVSAAEMAIAALDSFREGK